MTRCVCKLLFKRDLHKILIRESKENDFSQVYVCKWFLKLEHCENADPQISQKKGFYSHVFSEKTLIYKLSRKIVSFQCGFTGVLSNKNFMKSLIHRLHKKMVSLQRVLHVDIKIGILRKC